MDTLLPLFTSIWQGRALQLAAEVCVADHLRNGPKHVSELATLTNCNQGALYRVLRALVCVGVFDVDDNDHQVFRNNKASELLMSDAETSLKWGVTCELSGLHYELWGEAMYSLKTGKSACLKSFGMPFFDIYSRPENAEKFRNFGLYMQELTRHVTPVVIQSYDWSSFESIVDLGGNHGQLVGAIQKVNPSLKAFVFDIPAVIEAAKVTHPETTSPDSKLQFVSGDFFVSVPESDLYTMKYILHDWDDDQCVTILRNIHKSIKKTPKSRVIVFDSLVDLNPRVYDFAKFFDLQMLVAPGGRERTEREFDDLFTKSGFKLLQAVRIHPLVSLIVASVIY